MFHKRKIIEEERGKRLGGHKSRKCG